MDSKDNNKKYKQVDLVADYKALFENEKGQRVLYDLMKKCHFMHTSFDGDVHNCIFREGERNVVNYILTMLKQDPVKLKLVIDKLEEEEINYV
jgi:hypothetical protein